MSEKNKDEFITMVAEIFDVSPEDIDLERSRDDYEEWDSLAHVQIVARAIDELDNSITLEDTIEIKSLGEFLQLLER